jgi:hypothetical protein
LRVDGGGSEEERGKDEKAEEDHATPFHRSGG